MKSIQPAKVRLIMAVITDQAIILKDRLKIKISNQGIANRISRPKTVAVTDLMLPDGGTGKRGLELLAHCKF
jgi:hypothetical protein